MLTKSGQENIQVSSTGVQPAQAIATAATSQVINSTTGSQEHPQTRKNVVVVVHGNKMDAEIIKMACMFARAKQSQILALYGIEVPRKNALEDPLPTEEGQASRALQFATAVAERYDYTIETEIVKTRNFALSVVDEVNHHGSTVLVLGVPYQGQCDGCSPIDEETDYIMEHATCRVLLIRGCKENAQA